MRAIRLIRDWKWNIAAAVLVLTAIGLWAAGVGDGSGWWHWDSHSSGPWWLYAAGFAAGSYLGNMGVHELQQRRNRRQ
jgi:hypothetical protein